MQCLVDVLFPVSGVFQIVEDGFLARTCFPLRFFVLVQVHGLYRELTVVHRMRLLLLASIHRLALS